MPKSKAAVARHDAAFRHQQQVKLWQFLILGGVVVAVLAIFFLKQAPAASPLAALSSTAPTLQAPVAQASAAQASAGQAPNAASASLASVAQAPAELPEVQLMRALENGRPTLAFFHSKTCDSCKEMTAIVQEVYPTFASSVALVDVDVYDARNAGLLRSIGIRAIPTVVFFDRTGAGKMQIGVMPAADLRQVLSELQQGG